MSRRPVASPSRLPRIVALTLRAYTLFLALHPTAFRREFGVAIRQVFRLTCLDAYRTRGTWGVVQLWFPALGDVVHGALAEHALVLFPDLKGSLLMLQYRRSASLVFSAYIAFVLAGLGFAKMSEDVMKSSLPSAYPVFTIAYDVVSVLSVVSLVAILVGGTPVAFAALRFAWAQQRRDILARFAVPPIALVIIVGYVLIAMSLHLEKLLNVSLQTSQHFLGIGLIVVLLAGAIASTAAVLSAIARSDVDERLLRFAIRPGMLATIAMLGMTVTVVIWHISMWQYDPTLFWGNDGVLASSTVVSILINDVVMVGACVIALRATMQGLTSTPSAPQIA